MAERAEGADEHEEQPDAPVRGRHPEERQCRGQNDCSRESRKERRGARGIRRREDSRKNAIEAIAGSRPETEQHGRMNAGETRTRHHDHPEKTDQDRGEPPWSDPFAENGSGKECDEQWPGK